MWKKNKGKAKELAHRICIVLIHLLSGELVPSWAALMGLGYAHTGQSPHVSACCTPLLWPMGDQERAASMQRNKKTIG